MSTHNISFYEDSSNIIKYALYHFFCNANIYIKIGIGIIFTNKQVENSSGMDTFSFVESSYTAQVSNWRSEIQKTAYNFSLF